MPTPETSPENAAQDCVCGHEWEAHYGGGCDYKGCGCRRDPTPDAAPRLPDGWLRERLREVLPNATDEQIDGLVAVAEDYGRQLREARNV